MTRTPARITTVLGVIALLALAAGCDKAAELLSPDLSPCIARRIDQIDPGWDGGGAPCLVVTWDTVMIPNRADRELDAVGGGPQMFAAVKAAGYGGPACSMGQLPDAEGRAGFASRFGRLTERALEWNADLFLLVANPQPQVCDGYFDR